MFVFSYVMRCTIWYHLYNLKNMKITYGGVLLSVKLQASACNFTKSNTPPWVFFTFSKLCKWYEIAQSITYILRKMLNILLNLFQATDLFLYPVKTLENRIRKPEGLERGQCHEISCNTGL